MYTLKIFNHTDFSETNIIIGDRYIITENLESELFQNALIENKTMVKVLLLEGKTKGLIRTFSEDIFMTDGNSYTIELEGHEIDYKSFNIQ